jgi:sec-independent protein translocase protein TatA
MARSIGQSARVFKGEMKGMKDDGTPRSDTPAAAAAPLPPAEPFASSMPVTPAAVQPEPAPTPGQGHSATGQ